MKKILNCLLLLLIIFMLCSCKEKKYELIEVTSNDLVTNLQDTKNKTFVFATLNSDLKDNNKFRSDLEKASKAIKSNIYFIDASKANFWDDETIYIMTNVDTSLLYYYVYNKKGVVVANPYKDYNDIVKNLQSYTSQKMDIVLTDKEKKKHLELAKKEYAEGNISSAFNDLSYAWTLKEAKNFYNNCKYFKLLNEWEYAYLNHENLKFKSYVFFGTSTYLYYYNYNGLLGEFNRPSATDYDSMEYYVKDDIIYLTDDNGKVSKEIKILSLTNSKMTLEEDGKKYNFEVRD